ncbi:MAG TPA: hypothetical protein VKX17_14550 [Planctomycetota bacterium]|nr:hypothetical protein [Planctomycetota bacterium]
MGREEIGAVAIYVDEQIDKASGVKCEVVGSLFEDGFSLKFGGPDDLVEVAKKSLGIVDDTGSRTVKIEFKAPSPHS